MADGHKDTRITYGNVLTTLVVGITCFLWLTDVSNATEVNAAEIEKQRELQQLENKHIQEKLDDIKNLLKKITENIE